MDLINSYGRTPLSIALTGMDLLVEQLREGVDAKELISTAQDIRLPCLTGVSILNELLDFEKLDSGLMTMEKTEQDPLVFIESTLAPFFMVAKQKGVTLQVSNRLITGAIAVDIDETKVAYIELGHP